MTLFSIYLTIWHQSSDKSSVRVKALKNLYMEKIKTVAIVFDELKQDMQENLFSIILDANNERRLQKMYPYHGSHL